MLGRHLRQFVPADLEPLELGSLPFELLALGSERRRIGLERDAALAPPLPRAVKLRDLAGGVREAAVGIEQLALSGRAPERLVLMLAMYVHPATAQIPQ